MARQTLHLMLVVSSTMPLCSQNVAFTRLSMKLHIQVLTAVYVVYRREKANLSVCTSRFNRLAQPDCIIYEFTYFITQKAPQQSNYLGTISNGYFVLVFFSPFSIAITSLEEERGSLGAFRTFVRFSLVWFCLFPLPLRVWEGLQLVIVALPGLFSYLF